MSISEIILIEISSFYDNDRHFSKKYRRLGRGEKGRKVLDVEGPVQQR
jgi:hypothetical protein